MNNRQKKLIANTLIVTFAIVVFVALFLLACVGNGIL